MSVQPSIDTGVTRPTKATRAGRPTRSTPRTRATGATSVTGEAGTALERGQPREVLEREGEAVGGTAGPSTAVAEPGHGAEVLVALNRLKASPRNARRTAHAAATVEALAASIRVKGVLQPPVVEVERREDGTATGYYLVTIGEGRRQALRLLARRKAIRKTHPVRVIVDADNDAHEISLDENITREAMHPADQFEAFSRLAEDKGYGPEEIAARFGVSAHTVRQRLRLGAAAPELITAYREGTLALDQLTAFCVSDDQGRQRQVLDQIGTHTPAFAIRRAMTEAKVRVDDRRVRFVSVEAYEAEGGTVLRDLFTEDGGGWLEDVGLLDRLVAEKLEALAVETREREGWAWAEARLEGPDLSGFGRVYPVAVARSEAELATLAALSEEYDGLVSDAGEGLSPEADARLEAIDAALQAFGPEYDYAPEAKARAGVVVRLGHDGLARFERGLVRAQDVVSETPPWAQNGAEAPDEAGEGVSGSGDSLRAGSPTEDDGETSALSDRLILDLSAHLTMGLRDAVQAEVGVALATVVHAMALQVFYPGYGNYTPLQIRLSVAGLDRHSPGIGDTSAGRRVMNRWEAWGARLPERADALWAVIAELAPSAQLELLACCAGMGLDALRYPHDRRAETWAQATTLATAVGLDMRRTWTATSDSYFSRVSKPRILEAVTEAVNDVEAGRIARFKKTDMAEAAERLVEGTGWLPSLLRTVPVDGCDGADADRPSESGFETEPQIAPGVALETHPEADAGAEGKAKAKAEGQAQGEGQGEDEAGAGAVANADADVNADADADAEVQADAVGVGASKKTDAAQATNAGGTARGRGDGDRDGHDGDLAAEPDDAASAHDPDASPDGACGAEEEPVFAEVAACDASGDHRLTADGYAVAAE